MLTAKPYRLLRSLPAYNAAATRHAHAVARGSDITSTPQPTVTGEDGARTLRQRQHGSRALPLPPLMDPIALEAKNRYTEPKPFKPVDGKTDFQRQLEANPYAHALATPVRQCALTNARLPSHFLLSMVSHIDLQQPPHEASISDIATPQLNKSIVAKLTPDLDLTIPYHLRSPARSYILGHQHLVQHVGGKRRWAALVTERMKRWLGLKVGKQWHNFKVQKDWEWDGKTDEQVLEKLRDDVREKLKEACKRRQVVAVKGEEEMREVVNKGMACLLKVQVEESDGKSGFIYEQTSYDKFGGHSIPVYDTAELLGKERLRMIAGIELAAGQGLGLAVLRLKGTVELQMALLKLHAYLCHSEHP